MHIQFVARSQKKPLKVKIAIYCLLCGVLPQHAKIGVLGLNGNKGSVPMTIQKIKILGAVLELPAKHHRR